MCSQIQPLLDDVAPRNARSPLQKTSLRGLQIYRPTGQYYAHFRANGKPVRKRLETTVRAIAEQKLRDQKRLHRGAVSSNSTKRTLTFGDALADYRHTVDAAVEIKNSSKEYREQTIVALLRS